ncbi:MAG TPA: hypothetical protein PLO94_06675 [Chitinophagales bacterium]|nr:hypothetical protein [Chitinophagales bacterium]
MSSVIVKKFDAYNTKNIIHRDMGKVRYMTVYNDDEKDYEEIFKGETVSIPGKSSVIMDKADAHAFKSQYRPIIRDGLGRDMVVKKIRIEPIFEEENIEEAPQKFICMIDGQEFPTQEELNRHIRNNYSDLLSEEGKKSVQSNISNGTNERTRTRRIEPAKIPEETT